MIFKLACAGAVFTNTAMDNASGRYSPCYSPCAASLAGIPPEGLGLSELVHEEAHPSVSKFI